MLCERTGDKAQRGSGRSAAQGLGGPNSLPTYQPGGVASWTAAQAAWNSSDDMGRRVAAGPAAFEMLYRKYVYHGQLSRAGQAWSKTAKPARAGGTAPRVCGAVHPVMLGQLGVTVAPPLVTLGVGADGDEAGALKLLDDGVVHRQVPARLDSDPV
jgi:hypothetical protein